MIITDYDEKCRLYYKDDNPVAPPPSWSDVVCDIREEHKQTSAQSKGVIGISPFMQ
jgi:hypothetical protein